MGGATLAVRFGKPKIVLISIHAPRGGSDYTKEYIDRCKEISIHAPRGGSDGFTIAQQLVAKISIHAPRGGSDRIFNAEAWYAIDFNPRSPWGERRMHGPYITMRPRFQSTLPVGGATTLIACRISYRVISIHAPRGGSDWVLQDSRNRSRTFQSTLPVGGATKDNKMENLQIIISIHAPRGGSDSRLERKRSDLQISIHAPRGGSDGLDAYLGNKSYDFNPRSPWGERLVYSPALFPPSPISIHAPRGGSDLSWILCRPQSYDFNPRSPWGERRSDPVPDPVSAAFQSTLPVGGATYKSKESDYK